MRRRHGVLWLHLLEVLTSDPVKGPKLASRKRKSNAWSKGQSENWSSIKVTRLKPQGLGVLGFRAGGLA